MVPNGTSFHRAPAPAIGQLADLVWDVVDQLETPSHCEPLGLVVAECNAALEGCLETERAAREVEDRVASTDELRRLARLLTVVDPADASLVMRQIRRVLARLDAVGA